MTLRFGRWWAIIAALVFASPPLFALDIPIRYVKHNGTPQEYRPYGSLAVNLSKQCPEGKWTLPKLKCKEPLYGLTKMGDLQRLVVFDADPGDAFYRDLYYDANANGDLTDEKPLVAQYCNNQNGYAQASFAAIDTYIRLGDSSLPYRIRPSMSFYGGSKAPTNLIRDGIPDDAMSMLHCRFSVECSYTGEFTLDGRRYRVLLGDSNGNGRFDDTFTEKEYPQETMGPAPIFGGADQFCIAPEGKPVSYYDRMKLGDRLAMEGKLFNVSVSTPEAKLILTATTETLVTLRLPQPTKRLGLLTRDGSHVYMVADAGKEIKLPAGAYRLLEYILTKKDSQGDLWLLTAVATKDSPAVGLGGAGATEATLPFGEPYSPYVGVSPYSVEQFENDDADMVSLELAIAGIGDEKVTALQRMEGDKSEIPMSTKRGYTNQPKEPKYKITKADGESVKSGSFDYG